MSLTDITQQLSLDIQSNSVILDIETEDQKKIGQEIESKFQCYTAVIYTYMVIVALEAFGNLLAFIAHPSIKGGMMFAMTLIMLAAWIVGRQAKNNKDSSMQVKFQGLLIFFVMYHVSMIGLIIAESYTTIPYLTYTAFALNLIYGVLIPIIMYSAAEDLRKLMEKRLKASY